MKESNVRELKEWLDQFPDEDRAIASEAVRQLNFISSDEASGTLEASIEEILSKQRDENAAVMVEPVISRDEISEWRMDEVNLPKTQVVKGHVGSLFRTSSRVSDFLSAKERSEIAKKSTYVLYSDTEPASIRSIESGSEKLLDLVARNIKKKIRGSKEFRNMKFISKKLMLSDPDIKRRCIHLFLITDNIGSGTQAGTFLESAIASVRFGPLMNFPVVIYLISYCSTAQGKASIDHVIKTTKIDMLDEGDLPLPGKGAMRELISFRVTQTFHDAYDSRNRNGDEVMEFFSKYASDRDRKRNKGLGYGGAACRDIVLGASCPNTVPNLFYSTWRNSNYKPLFPNRIIRGDFATALLGLYGKDIRGIQTSAEFLEFIRKQRLVTAVERAKFETNPMWAVLLLAVAGLSRIDAVKLTHSSYGDFLEAEKELKSLGWIDSKFRATTRGKNIVRNFGRKYNYKEFKRAKAFLPSKLDASAITYYPSSVRGVQ